MIHAALPRLTFIDYRGNLTETSDVDHYQEISRKDFDLSLWTYGHILYNDTIKPIIHRSYPTEGQVKIIGNHPIDIEVLTATDMKQAPISFQGQVYGLIQDYIGRCYYKVTIVNTNYLISKNYLVNISDVEEIN